MLGLSNRFFLPLLGLLLIQEDASNKELSSKQFCDKVTVSLEAQGWKTNPSLAMGAIAAWEKFEKKKQVLRLTVLDLPMKMDSWKRSAEMVAKFRDKKAVVKVLSQFETPSQIRGTELLTTSAAIPGVYNWMRQIDLTPGKPLTFLGTASIPKGLEGKALEDLLQKKRAGLALVLDSLIRIQLLESLVEDKAGTVSFAFAKMQHQFKLPKTWSRKDKNLLRWEDSKGKGSLELSVLVPGHEKLPKLKLLLEQRTQVAKEKKPAKKPIKVDGPKASTSLTYLVKKKRVTRQVQMWEVKGIVFVLEGETRTSKLKKDVRRLLSGWTCKAQ